MPIVVDPDIVAPDVSGEPLTLDEVKLHLKVDDPTDDALISGMMIAARERAEHLTGRGYVQAARKLVLDSFPSGYEVVLPYAPLVSVESVTYKDTAGVSQSFTAFGVELDAQPGCITLNVGSSWPTTSGRVSSVKIDYTSGMLPANLPQVVRQWMLMQIGAMYDNRAAWTLDKQIQENPHIDRLLDSQRLWGAL